MRLDLVPPALGVVLVVARPERRRAVSVEALLDREVERRRRREVTAATVVRAAREGKESVSTRIGSSESSRERERERASRTHRMLHLLSFPSASQKILTVGLTSSSHQNAVMALVPTRLHQSARRPLTPRFLRSSAGRSSSLNETWLARGERASALISGDGRAARKTVAAMTSSTSGFLSLARRRYASSASSSPLDAEPSVRRARSTKGAKSGFSATRAGSTSKPASTASRSIQRSDRCESAGVRPPSYSNSPPPTLLCAPANQTSLTSDARSCGSPASASS